MATLYRCDVCHRILEGDRKEKIIGIELPQLAQPGSHETFTEYPKRFESCKDCLRKLHEALEILEKEGRRR